MAKNTNTPSTSPTPSPSPETETENNVVAMKREAGKPLASIFNGVAAATSKALNDKLATVSEAKQRLAEAHDLYSGSDNDRAKASEIANRAGLLLLDGLVGGAISQDELNGVLIDIWGAKILKSTGKPSKTPNGDGEHIRKRINRARDAIAFVNGQEATSFFEGLAPDRVEAVVADLRNPDSDTSLWVAYKTLRTMKGETRATVDPAFNPARYAAITATLRGEGVAEAIAGNPDLIEAIGQLVAMLDVVGQEVAEIVAERSDNTEAVAAE